MLHAYNKCHFRILFIIERNCCYIRTSGIPVKIDYQIILFFLHLFLDMWSNRIIGTSMGHFYS